MPCATRFDGWKGASSSTPRGGLRRRGIVLTLPQASDRRIALRPHSSSKCRPCLDDVPGQIDQAIHQLDVAYTCGLHSFGYILMAVKPGRVLISLTNSSRASPCDPSKKSTRPAQPRR